MICIVIPPAVLSMIASFFWELHWAVAATIFLAGSGVGWVIVIQVTMSHMKLIHIELRQELMHLYGNFDEDGMPIHLTETPIEEPTEEPEEEASTGFSASTSPPKKTGKKTGKKNKE